MKRKVLSLTLSFVMVLTVALTGCGADKSANSAGSASAAKAKTLTVWGMGAEGEQLPKMSDKFEQANQGLKVEVQALPWDQAHDKLLTAVASKSGPDVIQMGTSWVPEFADADALLDLTSYKDKYPNIKPQNYFDSSLQTTVVNGKYVSVPWYIDTRVLFYRSDLLAGVGYPKGPATWDELKDASAKLTARGKGNYGILLDPKDQMFTMTYAWQNGSDPISKDNVPHFNEAPFVDAVKYITSFVKEGYAPKQSDIDLLQAFKAGTYPMFVSGPWMVDAVKKNAPDLNGKWAVRTVPANKTKTSFVGGSNLVVFKPTKNVDEALKYINYMTDVDTQMNWLQVANSLPSRKEAWNNDKLKNDPLLSVFGEQMKDAKPAPFIKQWESVAQELVKAVENINVGGKDVQTELNTVNDKAKTLLKK